MPSYILATDLEGAQSGIISNPTPCIISALITLKENLIHLSLSGQVLGEWEPATGSFCTSQLLTPFGNVILGSRSYGNCSHTQTNQLRPPTMHMHAHMPLTLFRANLSQQSMAEHQRSPLTHS